MPVYISNAFSLSMLDREIQNRQSQQFVATPISLKEARGMVQQAALSAFYPLQSCVGHADVAAIYSNLLGVSIPVDRRSIKLEATDALIVGQYIGPRLPEGATELPADATIEWWFIH